MSQKEKNKTPPELDDQLEEAAAKEAAEEPAEAEAGATDPLMDELEALKDQAARQEEKYLRLAAEYDNFRKRTAKEKEAIWNDAKADAALAFLPVYDNLERALKQETADEAYKKGVEMTMNQLKTVLEKLGITEIEALGQPFDPTLHNAVMHIEDENFWRKYRGRGVPGRLQAGRQGGPLCHGEGRQLTENRMEETAQ